MNHRNTKQKQLLQQEITSFNSFFTAEEFFSKIHRKDSSVGIATIYRYLKNLTNEQKIHSFNCNRRTIYSNNSKNHCHFHCEECHTVTHITIKNIDFLHQNIKGKMCHFQIDINGICEECEK